MPGNERTGPAGDIIGQTRNGLTPVVLGDLWKMIADSWSTTNKGLVQVWAMERGQQQPRQVIVDLVEDGQGRVVLITDEMPE